MGSFNPYLVDEIVTQTNSEKHFGLIASSNDQASELHGFEITLSGRIVLPELRLSAEQEATRVAAC